MVSDNRKGVCSMASACRLLLYLLMLSLLNAASPVRASGAATNYQPQLSDEETIRLLTEQYSRAIAAGDAPAIGEFWNPQSPNLLLRLWFFRAPYPDVRIEFTTFEVTR